MIEERKRRPGGGGADQSLGADQQRFYTNPSDAATAFNRLTEALTMAPPHLQAVIHCVRDNGVGLLFVGQSEKAWRLPRQARRPAIIFIGDDLHEAIGPDRFHVPSLRRAIRACDSFAVIAGPPHPIAYAAAAATASADRKNVLIVETRPEHEAAWLSLIQKTAPGRHIWRTATEGAAQ